MVIVGILATIGLPVYQNVLESSKEKVCETNLLALQKAVEIYTQEHDTVPGSLTKLEDSHIQKAYASVMSGKGAWQRRLAYLIVEGPQLGLAYAAYGMPKLRCPSNPDPASVSYGLNCHMAGISSLSYKNLADNVLIVADSGSQLFEYTNAGAGDNPHWDISDSPIYPASDVSGSLKTRGHRKNRILSSPDLYFKGVVKNREFRMVYSTGTVH